MAGRCRCAYVDHPRRRTALRAPRARAHALVQAHYPEFIARFGAQDRSLPKYVHEEFEEFLR